MNFRFGDIVWFKFPRDPNRPQFTMEGNHPALILHDYNHPNQTIVLSPLSSLRDKNGSEKTLQSYHLKLLKKDYPDLSNDSFVKLDQIMTFSRHRIRGSTLICGLSKKDKASTHLKLIETLQMQDTIKELSRQQLDSAVERLLDEYIDSVLQQSTEKAKKPPQP
ncbi:type II toxin-antitoxin system PemK/MazF family toxin [Oceanobacillus oncorhynchi subsp. oncorhynchi]|uniref:type II toxin-antitoxin system PemK/MazF family toxin n=1 Tax=Oceanobacillus TaxID=182709 RepID=UPI0030DD3358